MNATQLLAHFDRLAEAPNAVLRLRRFILDLAVRGKLVEQVAEDEPAAELLKGIRTTRLQFLKKSVKSNATADTEIDGTDIELPTGWAWSKLGDLCIKTGSGSTPSGGKDAYVSSGVPFLRSQNVYDEGLRLDGVAFISESTHERMSSTTVKPSDLLLNITGGSIGRCAVVPDSFVIGNINQHVAIIRLALLESGRFLHSVICSDYFQKHIFGNQTGAGREGLPKNRMDQILIPVAPLAEQHRIVAKVDELMALCDQLEAAQQERERRRDRLATASLQRLNQPATNTTPEAQREHARFHLHHLPRLTTRPEHIKGLRNAFLEFAMRGVLVPQDKRDVRVVEMVTNQRTHPIAVDEIPFDLPESWAWTRLGAIAKLFNGDRGKNYPNRVEYVATGLPFINTGHIEPDGSLSVSSMNYITRKKFDSLNGGKIEVGDLVYCLRGATMGKTACVAPFTEGAIASSLVIIRLDQMVVDARFAYYFLTGPLGRSLIRRFDNGTAQPNLSAESVKRYLVPLPPLAEQRRIVAKVDELMELCDQLEAQLATTQTDSRRLLEAVLEAALAQV